MSGITWQDTLRINRKRVVPEHVHIMYCIQCVTAHVKNVHARSTELFYTVYATGIIFYTHGNAINITCYTMSYVTQWISVMWHCNGWVGISTFFLCYTHRCKLHFYTSWITYGTPSVIAWWYMATSVVRFTCTWQYFKRPENVVHTWHYVCNPQPQDMYCVYQQQTFVTICTVFVLTLTPQEYGNHPTRLVDI